MEVRVRPETPADEAAIREINMQAFGRPEEARLVDALRASEAFIPALSLVAECEGHLVGHILFSRGTVEGEGEPVELLALGPLAVRPECQRQGVGGQLVRAGLERAAALGYRAVFLIGHPTYYPRFGFVPGSRLSLKSTYDVPDDVFMALPLRPDGLDGVHGTVVYAPAFAEV
jgi:putative acetyltransferase